MDRVQSIVLVVLALIMIGSTVSMLFSIAYQYPVAETDPRPAENFDTSFWDLTDALTTPLDINNISDTIESVETSGGAVDVNSWKFDFYSETYDTVDIRINSILVQPTNRVGDAPGVLVLHGYGSNYMGFIEVIRQIAAAGYVVLGIDSPGSGLSTAFPPLNPYTFFDVSDGPESAHIYHSVWSAARAVTLLESLPYVNSTIVLGGSMGGLETFILSAIDSRVDASIPMIAGGNFDEPLKSGSLFNSLINPNYEIDSEEIDQLQQWFDPIAYARLLTRPVFMFYGTNDPFFVLSGLRQTTDAITAPLTLSIRPNSGHVIDLTWIPMVVRWMDELFRGGPDYLSVETSLTSDFTSFGYTLRISANVSTDIPLSVCWRTSDPGSVWAITPMQLVGGEYILEISPYHLGKVTYFVCAAEGEILWVSSEVQEGYAGAYITPLTALFSAIGVFVMTRISGWRLTRLHLLRETPMFVGLIMIGLGFLLPFYGIHDRVQLSMLDFLEVYGQTLGLGGWFLSLTVLILCYIISLSAVRHQLPFKLVMGVWFPLLVIITIAYIFFAGVFALAGGLASIYTGVGAFLLLFAVPVMLILESVFNKIIFDVKNVLPVPVSPSA
ncbi:MAG: alpha/beta fold hydrolase [Candidatus Thorarchaeota archaeon]|jgi:pimeloyl-ACP methyl ester carboxylesterase